jgi:hypothetical protein
MRFVEKLMQMVSQGLSNFGPQVAAEFSRLGTQGSMEAASGLFNGSAFVPYGPGQYTPTPEAPDATKENARPELFQEEEHGREM